MATRKQKQPILTDPSCYTYYDRKNEICWVLQPPICEQGKDNTGLSEKSLEHIKNSLNSWSDSGVETYIVDDQPLGDYMLGENLTEFTEKSIAFAVKLNLDKSENYSFMNNPTGYLFDSKDNLFDDVEILSTISFSPCSNGGYSIDYSVVNEKYRGKGIGGRMIKSFIDNQDFFTYGRRVKTLYTSVREDNTRSLAMLKKLGFVVAPHYGRLSPSKNGKCYHTYKKSLVDEMEMM